MRLVAMRAAMLAASCLTMPSAHGAETYAHHACDQIRQANPGYTMPIHVQCLRWIKRGNPLHWYLTSEVTHFYCPELGDAKYHKLVDMVDYPANGNLCNNPNATMR